MMKELVKENLSKLEGDKLNKLIAFMNDKGYDVNEWFDVEKADFSALQLVDEFMNNELAIDNSATANSTPPQIDFEEIKKLGKKNKNKNKKEKDNEKGEDSMELVKENINQEGLTIIDNKADNNKVDDNNAEDNNEGKAENTTQDANGVKKSDALKQFKTVDNIVYMVEPKETTIDDVKEITKDRLYRCDINAQQLAHWFLNGALTYDPSMQRGIKEDKNNVERANFRESHVKEIYDSMLAGTFTPTQIQLAIITDDEDVSFDYDEDTKELAVNGKIRLVDGQHRIRAASRIKNEIFYKKINGIDLEDILFNVQIHVCTADEARIVYANIDKNLKLDKSQTKQLSADAYAKVVNFLNQNTDSDMRGKIATSKPVGSKLVLFANLAEAIQKNVEINNSTERDEVAKYLRDFFNYVSTKIVDGFSATDSKRAEFRKNNLLNENNFFPAWIKVAFLDKDNYKQNVDKIAENINMFNKDYQEDEVYVWWKANTVKAKTKGDGFAMNNTSTGIKAMTDITLNLLGIDENKKVDEKGDDKGDGKQV